MPLTMAPGVIASPGRVLHSFAIRGPRPWVDVTALGARGDGTTDDTAAIQAAWAALAASGGVLLFPPGTYAITDTLSFTDKLFTTILAHGATIIVRSGAAFSGKKMLTVAGSSYLNVQGLSIDSRLGASNPAAGLVLGRTGSYSGSNQVFQTVKVTGKFTVGGTYLAAAEVIMFRDCYLQCETASVPAVYDTDDDSIRGLTTSGTNSNTRKMFDNCTLSNDAAGGAVASTIIRLSGWQYEITFRDCYLFSSSTGALTVVSCVDETTPDANGTTVRLTIENCRVEQTTGNAGSRLLVNSKTAGMTNLLLSQVNWAVAGSTYLIDDNKGIASSRFEFGDGLQATDLIHVASGAVFRLNRLWGNLSAGGVGRIQCDAGGYVSECIFENHLAGFPIKGAGQYDEYWLQNNVVISAGVATAGALGSYISVPAIRRRHSYFTDQDTTPDVSGFSLFTTLNTVNTSITAFDFASSAVLQGDTITVFIADTHTTFVHGSTNGTLRMAGSVNYTPTNGSNVTFTWDETTGTGVWRETGRTAA